MDVAALRARSLKGVVRPDAYTIRPFFSHATSRQPWEGRRAPLSRESTPVGAQRRVPGRIPATSSSEEAKSHRPFIEFPSSYVHASCERGETFILED